MSTTSRHRSGRPGADPQRSRGATATGTGTRTGTRTRVRTQSGGALAGLRNERTKIVGDRTGMLADLQVVLVRAGRSAGNAIGIATRHVTAVVTPLGWSMLAVVAVSFIVGYAASWMELVAVAWAGTVIIAVASLFLIGAGGHDIGLRMPHDRVVVGDRAVGALTVTNPKRRRLLGATIEIPVGDGLLELPLPSIGAGGSHDDVFTVPTTKRGIIEIGPVRTVRADPIGLVRREQVWAARVELYVHPKTVSIPSASTGFVRDLEGHQTRDLTSSDVAFHALRDYQPGDDRRYIHWKSTARQGELMVRQFEETRRSHLMVALSLAEADYEDDEQFELAVSVAGSLGVRAIRDARTVSVVASERTPEFAKRKVFATRNLRTVTPVRLLDDLAGVTKVSSALGITDLARVAAEQVSGISVAFLVLGSTPTVAALRTAAASFPAGVEVVAVVCDAGFAPGLTRVGELTVLTVGFLDDLQKSLARSGAL
ncbi:DUF58 domain-containing protein [Herbiconiux sp. L3-i23]|uniref:DUF58 domain-containing protein n=1 Tax=Herbiconiux sp. L3-i23 TaxID=2905871 RepID=UPI00205F7AC6|nr:DUF58 domain-containing protein [Herbiconiux sp. L3-i23]BDI22030.1 hypothetical protein L3i23_08060 [Herbiconiux sp. L3-i23]